MLLERYFSVCTRNRSKEDSLTGSYGWAAIVIICLFLFLHTYTSLKCLYHQHRTIVESLKKLKTLYIQNNYLVMLGMWHTQPRNQVVLLAMICDDDVDHGYNLNLGWFPAKQYFGHKYATWRCDKIMTGCGFSRRQFTHAGACKLWWHVDYIMENVFSCWGFWRSERVSSDWDLLKSHFDMYSFSLERNWKRCISAQCLPRYHVHS